MAAQVLQTRKPLPGDNEVACSSGCNFQKALSHRVQTWEITKPRQQNTMSSFSLQGMSEQLLQGFLSTIHNRSKTETPEHTTSDLDPRPVQHLIIHAIATTK